MQRHELRRALKQNKQNKPNKQNQIQHSWFCFSMRNREWMQGDMPAVVAVFPPLIGKLAILAKV